MNDNIARPRRSPPFSHHHSDTDFFKALQSQMDDDQEDASLTAGNSSQKKAAAKTFACYLDYCKEFLDFNLYPKLSEENRAVIADFFSGELLQNAQWKHLYPHGYFECNLNTTPGPDTPDYTCTECTVFRINFEEVSCTKEIRRVWTPKRKSKAPEPSPKARSQTKQRADSPIRDHDDDLLRNGSLELQSPIKAPSKRRTPTRRRSFEERDERRRSSSRATSTRSVSIERPVKKLKDAVKASQSPSASPKKRGRPKKSSVAKKKAETEPAAVPAPEDQTWEVLTILDSKRSYGKYSYLVRWAGMDPEGKPWDDTWEPAANISDDLIREYWARMRAEASSPKGGKTVLNRVLNSEISQPAA